MFEGIEVIFLQSENVPSRGAILNLPCILFQPHRDGSHWSQKPPHVDSWQPCGLATTNKSEDRYPAAVAFFNRCRESSNPEFLFREGLSECFFRCYPDAGLDLLRSTAVKGHDAAKYTASLVIFLRQTETSAMEQALEWFRSVDASGLLRECMRLCSKILRSTSRPAV
ncbi:hypothetical protein Ahy_B10g102350 [Arachis hypogaea]|uniref:At2g35280-like TPR domain-containing protein n=1 Tax=Arachis hypogaea TaxID=3818 RepID=A0A444X1I9_ARAHY|nr:hypothetical protein Ahy_B10g102350 [Arachis hypogaea]